MAKRVGGFRRKTRSKLRKNVAEKGKLSIGRYLQQFNEGEMVYLNAEPAVQKGMYFPRFHAKAGTILKKQGACYHVAIKDGKKQKTFIIHPVHLKRV
ncbi:50S ribosomal protein L21e [Candidatus Woesearchaeota archaeon]|nr:50S ribosomal protein L21e [Candidatus Woesearchaeota archaeon]